MGVGGGHSLDDDLLLSDVMELVSLYRRDRQLFDRIESAVKEWIEDDTADLLDLILYLEASSGRRVGRLLITLLAGSQIDAHVLLRLVELHLTSMGMASGEGGGESEIVDSLLRDLKKLVARYRRKVYVRVKREMSPYAVVSISVNLVDAESVAPFVKPPVIRLRATLANGDEVTIDLGLDDLKLLIGAIARRKELLEKINEALNGDDNSGEKDDDGDTNRNSTILSL
jgi:hypothetical protein